MVDLDLRIVDGVLHVPVRVKPRASRSRVLGVKQGALEVAVAAPPVDGAANAELVRVLARLFAVPRSRLTLVAGKAGRNKKIAVQGVSSEQCRSCLLANALRP